nr:GMC oxidoreductase [Bradyrhizobium sp. 76]
MSRLPPTDPFALPKIDSGYLSPAADLAPMVAAALQVRKVAAQPALAPFIAKELEPGCEIRREDELRDWIRGSMFSGKHPVGTCRMGSDYAAVVDPQLRVRGVEKLRVVDASVKPTIIGGNTNASTIMIAEKAADLICAAKREGEAPWLNAIFGSGRI